MDITGSFGKDEAYKSWLVSIDLMKLLFEDQQKLYKLSLEEYWFLTLKLNVLDDDVEIALKANIELRENRLRIESHDEDVFCFSRKYGKCISVGALFKKVYEKYEIALSNEKNLRSNFFGLLALEDTTGNKEIDELNLKFEKIVEAVFIKFSEFEQRNDAEDELDITGEIFEINKLYHGSNLDNQMFNKI